MDFKQWMFQLWDTRKNAPIDDDSGVVNVLTAGAPTEVTITDRFGTALANPLAFSNGKVVFYTAKTVTSVDLAVLTASMHAVFMTDVSSSEHRIDINPDKREQTLIVPFFAATTTDPVSTGFVLASRVLIKDAGLVVTTAESATTMDVGLDDEDTDGLLDDVSLAATGIPRAAPVATAGANIDFLAVSKYGALLADELATAGDTVTQNGAYARKYFATTGSETVVYAHAAATNLGKGYIFIDYTRLNDL